MKSLAGSVRVTLPPPVVTVVVPAGTVMTPVCVTAPFEVWRVKLPEALTPARTMASMSVRAKSPALTTRTALKLLPRLVRVTGFRPAVSVVKPPTPAGAVCVSAPPTVRSKVPPTPTPTRVNAFASR